VGDPTSIIPPVNQKSEGENKRGSVVKNLWLVFQKTAKYGSIISIEI
jgi:hypothetical protein